MLPNPDAPMLQPSRAPESLVDPTDVRRAIDDLFDAGGDSGLVIRVYGEDGRSAAALDTFREMLASSDRSSITSSRRSAASSSTRSAPSSIAPPRAR